MTAEIRVDKYTETSSGFWWCRLELDPSRFERTWVCCPGDTKDKALEHATNQAEMVRVAHVPEIASVKEAVERPRTRRRERKRVSTPRNATPSRTREIPAGEPVLTPRLSLRDRLKQRNTEGAA